MKYTLPISPSYCEHWGLWEAVREIYQNALDEAATDKECTATIDYFPDVAELHITTSKGTLSPKSLLLGNTSKRNDQTLRGKFGEGYKLALLVLVRSEHGIAVLTGKEQWTPTIEHDDNFNSQVLVIYVDPYTEQDGVTFIVYGVRPDQWADIQANIRPQSEFFDTILEDESQKGRIYVGGLYVATAKEFQCGYSFRPGVVKLDRDRGMVDGFDLAWETSRLWTSRGHSERLSELLEAEAPDVEYVESHVSEGSSFASSHYNYYVSRHGQAVPVSSQEEIQRATAAGLKWVLVPEKVKSMLRLIKSWIIPSSKSLLDRLKDFREKNQYYLTNNGKTELNEIIQSLEEK